MNTVHTPHTTLQAFQKKKTLGTGFSGESMKDTLGDFDGAFGGAAVKIDATYTTPDEAHAMMEPFATIAAWEGDKLTVWTSNQMINWGKRALASILGIEADNVRVDSPYIGGGFGGKLFIRADAVMAALGAKAAKRPVKIAMQRPLMFNNSTHRPATIQRVRLGAGSDGRITAIAHECWSANITGEDGEHGTLQTPKLYTGANRLTASYVSQIDLPEGNAMRAPGEAPGHMALEVAMDALRCPPPDAIVDNLSGGERRRVALQGVERDGEQLLRVEGSQLLGQGLGVGGVDVHGLVLLRAGVHCCAC